MNVEENRLRTFGEWPANAAVDASRIAKAGFYYTGHGLEVQCFLCGTRISDWNYGDQAMARHRLAEPTCPFVVNSNNTCNVPLIRRTDSNVAVQATSPSSQQPRDVNHSTNVTQNSVVRSNDPLTEYGTVSQRLGSFDNWPIPSIISPQRLAEAGFYYLQHGDMVECAFCRGVIMKWEAGDDPDREHRLHFPSCDFYMKTEVEDDGLELANVKLLPGTGTDLAVLGIQTHKAPINPKHATYEARLQTFHGWPKNIKQTPEMLAAAGFYYVGHQDQVRCYHCDGGLRGWEPNDDVWTEHARWFPKCGYVSLVRGYQFIQQCVNNRPALDLSTLGAPAEENENISESLVSPISSSPSACPEPVIITTVQLLELVPETMPESVSEAVLETISDSVPAVPQFVSEAVPESISESVPESVSEAVPELVSEAVSESVSEEVPESILEAISESVPETVSESTSELISESMSELILESMSELVVEPISELLETVSRPVSESISERVSKPVREPVTDMAIDRLLETTPAKTALEVGLHAGRIKRVLKKKMQQTGLPYTDAQELIEDVLYDQVMEEDASLDNNILDSPSTEPTDLMNQIVTMQIFDDLTNLSNNPINNGIHSEPNKSEPNKSDENCGNSIQESNVFNKGKVEEKKAHKVDNTTYLQEENRRLREARLCKICMDQEVAVVFLPCGHLATCVFCAPPLTYCPMCRVKIRANVRIFLS